MTTRSSLKTFRFGLPPHLSQLSSDEGLWTRTKSLLQAWLEPFVGRVTPVITAKYYGNATALREGHLDVAWLPPLVAYNLVESGQEFALLARCVRNGQQSNSSGLLVKQGEDLSKNLRSGRWTLSDGAFVHESSTSGFLLPIYELHQDQLIELPRSLRRLSFLGQPGTQVAVQAGRSAFGAMYLPPHIKPGDEIGAGLIVSRVCYPLPSETLVVRNGDDRIVEALKAYDVHTELQQVLGVEGWGAPDDAETEVLKTLASFSEKLKGAIENS